METEPLRELSDVLYSLDTRRKLTTLARLDVSARCTRHIRRGVDIPETTLYGYLQHFANRNLVTRIGNGTIATTRWTLSELGQRAKEASRYSHRWIGASGKGPGRILGKNSPPHKIGSQVNRLVLLSMLQGTTLAHKELLARFADEGVQMSASQLTHHLNTLSHKDMIQYTSPRKKQGTWARYQWNQQTHPSDVQTGSAVMRRIAAYMHEQKKPLTRHEVRAAVAKTAAMQNVGAMMYQLLQDGFATAPFHYGRQSCATLTQKGTTFVATFARPLLAAFQS